MEDIMQSILARLESLEQKFQTPNPTSRQQGLPVNRGQSVFINRNRKTQYNQQHQSYSNNIITHRSYSDVVKQTNARKPHEQYKQQQQKQQQDHNNKQQRYNKANRNANNKVEQPRGKPETKTHQQQQQQHVSNNPQFAQILKSLYRGTQLQHHSKNWDKLPQPIERNIDRLFKFLTPPVPTEELKDQLDSLKGALKHDIRTIVKTHINIQIEINRKQLKNTFIQDNDKQAARGLAERVVLRKYGNKATRTDLNQWLMEDLSIIGQNWFDQQVTQQIAMSTTETTSITATTSTLTSTEGVSRKRKIESPIPAVPVSNRFDVLNDEAVETEGTAEIQTLVKTRKITRAVSPTTINNNEIIENDKDDMDETWSMNSRLSIESQPDPQMRRSQTSDSMSRSCVDLVSLQRKNSKENIIMHDGNKKLCWQLNIKKMPHTVIMADSNFRPARNIPGDWEVHVFPGANIAHATKMLDATKFPDSVKNVVVAVGINNKSGKFDMSTKPELDKLWTATKKWGPRIKMHFLGISTSNQSPTTTENIKKINEFAKQHWERNFIPSLPENQVTISPSDPFRIHHDIETVDRVINSIKIHLN